MSLLTADRGLLRAALERVLPVVPSKPLIPAHGQVHIYMVDEGSAIVESTDGSLYARSSFRVDSCDGFDDVLPAIKLAEMLKRIPDPQATIDVTNRARTELRGSGAAPGQIAVSFTFPLLADADSFPSWQAATDRTPVARGIRAPSLISALNRVDHALAGPEASNPSLRLVQLRMGRAVAFSGRRLQEAKFEVGAWNQQGRAEPLPVLLPDVAIPPLMRFLASMVGAADDVAISIVEQVRGSGLVRYVAVETDIGGFYWPHPRIEFANLEVTRANAARHRRASARLVVARAALQAAVRAARIQADPDAPALVLDFTRPRGAPIRAVAGTDESNLFEMELPHAHLVNGEQARVDTASFSLDDLQGVLDACPDETVHLYVAPASVTATSGQRQKPLSTLIDSEGALAVIPQQG